MKKLFTTLMIIGLVVSSCGDADEAAKNIDVSKLDSPCACAEAALQVMEAINPHTEAMSKIESEKEAKAYVDEHGLGDLEKKYEEIKKKCVGDLSMDKADKDCDAIKKLQELNK